jgi:hypothetical protein
MKIRHIFEPKDFDGRGQTVVRASYQKDSVNFGYLTSVAYKIGYSDDVRLGEKQKACLISLSDGMVVIYDSIEDVCDRLNNDPHGYRPLENNEACAIVEFQGNRFR